MSTNTSKKAKTPAAVPTLGDPDRKRVLNVLAQRRYRQKRREKIAELEAKLKSGTSPSASQSSAQLDQSEISRVLGGQHALSPEEGSVEKSTSGAGHTVEIFPLDLGNEPAVDFGFFSDLDFSTLDLPPQSSPTIAASSTFTSISLPQPPAFNYFPLMSDGPTFDIPFLPALRAFTAIATTLNITAHIYNPFYLHVLPPTPSPFQSSLPANLAPTPAQLTIPHHPMLDTLPWPSAREKLIVMFALPSFCRPTVAQDDEDGGQAGAVVRIMQDLDDWREGVRNHGNSTTWGEGNELIEEAWEVGEKFYQNWWWCLDGRVVEMSNRRRRERGLGKLRVVS